MAIKIEVEEAMLERLKRLITVGGWKSFFGGALLLYAAYLAGPDCVDISCTQEVDRIRQAGESFLGVGIAHKLQKLADTLGPLLRALLEKKP